MEYHNWHHHAISFGAVKKLNYESPFWVVFTATAAALTLKYFPYAIFMFVILTLFPVHALLAP